MSDYRYYLSLSSQFPFCGIPLRMDSYSRCQFSCRYCFASARGGNVSTSAIQLADPSALARRLEHVSRDAPRSALDELLAARVPIHFGGMSDPFMPLEAERGVTLALLRVLRDHAYPTVVSTKGTLQIAPKYAAVLSAANFVVQFSLTSSSDERSKKIDVGVAPTSERIRVLEALTSAGVKTAVRLQPLVPTLDPNPAELVERSAHAGARHISVEHLKLPIERNWQHRERLSAAVGIDMEEHYRERGATRMGREWVLPAGDRLPTMQALQSVAHDHGMSFGAADTDLLHLSDGAVCCSGSDLLGLGSGFAFNFLTAIRDGAASGAVELGSLDRYWRPSRPITEFLNSRSRALGNTVESFIKARWNGVANGPSPASFYGVSDSGARDLNGDKIYTLSSEILDIYSRRRS